MDGLELTVRRDGAFAVLVAQGTSRTGTEKNPRTRRHRGPKTVDAVALSQRQMQFQFPGGEAFQPAPNVVERVTWIFLVHWDRKAEEVRCELSLPRNVIEGDFICDWSERILIPRLTEQFRLGKLPVPEVSPIDVLVQRRRAS